MPLTDTATTRSEPTRRPPAAPVLRLAGLRKSYGRVTAVDGLDLSVAAGEVVALLGPNGAGKSTTVDLLLGLQQPDAGRAELFGSTPRRATAAGRVGVMLQSGSLLPDLTVRELVTLLVRLHRSPLRPDEVLERAGVAHLAGRRTDRLSGGQAQRVRFALALAPDPDLLVLDEPTAAMDVEARRGFWDALRDWTATGGTVVFATHYLEEADAVADRVVLLRSGTVVADGSAASVKALVGGRRIRADLAPVAPDPAELRALLGVADVVVAGTAITLTCPDSDAALRALLSAHPTASDVEVGGAGLEDAFLALTARSIPSGRTSA
jgi:ABC-2 type transport system ATP-binding protein